MKKIRLTLIIMVLFLNLVSCGMSKSVLEDTSSNYEKALKDLCVEYGLQDAEVLVESDFSTKSDDGKIRLSDAIIKSDEFRDLSAEKAFSFAKAVSQLETNCEYDDGEYSLIFYTRIDSMGEAFYYDIEFILGSKMEYLMGYTQSYVTYNDSKMTYNIWD